MLSEIADACSRYIHNTEEPLRWLPIAALVYLLFEATRQARFWMDGKHPIWQGELLGPLRRRWLREHLSRALLLCVAGFASWGCVLQIAVPHRMGWFLRPNVPVHPSAEVNLQSETGPTGGLGATDGSSVAGGLK